MKTTLQAILDRAGRLDSRRLTLTNGLERVRATEPDVAVWIEGLRQRDEVFQLHPAEHIARVTADKVREWKQRRRAAAGVALYHLQCESHAFAPEVREFKGQAMRAPDAITAYLTRSGGKRINLSDETELLIQLVDEQRRSRFSRELQTTQPSTIHTRYAAALSDDGDEAASFVRWVEDTHAQHWSGAEPASNAEVQRAKDLRALITTAQELRVPSELAAVEQLLEDSRVLVSRAGNRDLYDIRPANPETEPAAAEAFQAEAEALTGATQ